MILVVTPNLALDVTYSVDRLVPNAAHRVRQVRTRAGGKGVNVARVVGALGGEARVVGFAGGATGDAVRRDLAASGLVDECVPVSGESRRTVAVVSRDDGDATLFNEPGPTVAAREWDALVGRCVELAGAASAVVLTGSVPPGVPDDSYATLVRLLQDHDRPVLLDAFGASLSTSLRSRPFLVKPNVAELATVTSQPDPVAGGRALRAEGAQVVVISLGPDGLIAITPHGAWRAAPPQRVSGNPIGAGDAAMAALAMGVVANQPWPDVLREAVACSAAAVHAPVAGEIDIDIYRRLRRGAEVEEIDAAHSA